MNLPPRRRRGRLLGGVCTGAARYWHIDVTLLRLAFLLLSLAWGVGLLLYLAAWLLMPPEGHHRRMGWRNSVSSNFYNVKGDLDRSRRRFVDAWQQRQRSASGFLPLSRHWLAVGLLSFGAVVLFSSFGAWIWLTPARALGLACLVLGGTIFFKLRAH